SDATAAADPAVFAPRAAKDCMIDSLESKIVSGMPASMRRRAMRPPIRPTPTKPTPSSDISHLLEHFARDSEAVHRCRHAAVARDLQKHFLDLVLRHAIRESALYMGLDLVRTIQRREHREV